MSMVHVMMHQNFKFFGAKLKSASPMYRQCLPLVSALSSFRWDGLECKARVASPGYGLPPASTAAPKMWRRRWTVNGIIHICIIISVRLGVKNIYEKFITPTNNFFYRRQRFQFYRSSIGYILSNSISCVIISYVYLVKEPLC